ncbi:MAG: Smr/MutS family protein [Sulfuricella denitrificans]|nr:Smr/MutS family protein [Sulfuricella denitrificans]
MVEDDDLTLFRSAIGDARPLRHGPRFLHPQPKPRPIPLQSQRDQREVLLDSLSDHVYWADSLENGEELAFLRPGVQYQVLRKLRRGHWVTQGELDLHGLTVAEAKLDLIQFLQHCQKHGLRCIRIIHGKGLRSKNREPVLKNKVAHWLMQRDETLAFCQAKANDGGSGAMLVLLKAF